MIDYAVLRSTSPFQRRGIEGDWDRYRTDHWRNKLVSDIRAEFRRLAEQEQLRCPTCHSLTLSGPTVEETIASMPICPKCGGRRECPEHLCA